MNILKYALIALVAICPALGQVTSVRRLNDLRDVQTTIPPTDGDVLSYDATTGRWTNAAAGAGVLNDAVYSGFVGGLTSSNLIDLTDLMVFTDPTGTSSYQIEVGNLFGGMALHDQTLYVDATNGDDTTGTRGRADRPYATLDAAMLDSLPNDIVFLRPGDHETAGSYHALVPSFRLQSGQAVVGSGKYNTRLLWRQGGILGPTLRNVILETPEDGSVSNCFVGNLTIESVLTNVFTADGGKVIPLLLYGNNHIVDNVEVRRYTGYTNGTLNSEAFGIMMGYGSNLVMRNCSAYGLIAGNGERNHTALIFVNASHSKMLNNFVDTYGNGLGWAYGGNDILVQGNTVIGADVGINADTGITNENVVITGNYFSGREDGSSLYGIRVFSGGVCTNLAVDNNLVRKFSRALLLTNSAVGNYFANLRVVNNHLRVQPDIAHVNGGQIANNMIWAVTSGISSVTNLWGIQNEWPLGKPLLGDLKFDLYVKDLYVGGTANLTNPVVAGGTFAGSTNIGTTVLATATATTVNAGTVNVTGTGMNVPGTITNGTFWGTNIYVNGFLQFPGYTGARALFLDAGPNLITTGTSAYLSDSLMDETGTGAAVFSHTPSITNVNLTTPRNATFTNLTVQSQLALSGLGEAFLVNGVGSVGVSGTSQNLSDTLTDETGTGAAVFSSGASLTNVTLVTPKDATFTNLSVTTLTTDELDVGTIVVTNALTVSDMNVADLVVTNGATFGAVSATTNVYSAAVVGTNTVSGGVVTATTNMHAPYVTVDDDAYAAGWDGSTNVPTKNAVYDKIQTISGTSPTTTRGDMIYRGAAADERLAIAGSRTNMGTVLFSDGTDPVWKNPRNYFFYEDDMLWSLTTPIFYGVNNNGSVDVQGTTIEGHPGVVMLTANSANDFPVYSMTGTSFDLQATYWWTESLIRTPAALSTDTEQYELKTGFLDTLNATNQVDGCFALYSTNLVGAKWGLYNVAGSVSNVAVSVSADVAANTWYWLGIEVASDSSASYLWVNGSCVATNTNNVPTAAVGYGYQLHKIVHASTTINMVMDYARLYGKFNTAR